MEDFKEALKFFNKIEIWVLFGVFLVALIMFFVKKDLRVCLSFLSGALVTFLSFITTRKEGFIFLKNIKAQLDRGEVPNYTKERGIFLGKIYLKLFAVGVIFYFLIAWLHLSPLFLVVGISWVYLELIVLSFINLRRQQKFA